MNLQVGVHQIWTLSQSSVGCDYACAAWLQIEIWDLIEDGGRQSGVCYFVSRVNLRMSTMY